MSIFFYRLDRTYYDPLHLFEFCGPEVWSCKKWLISCFSSETYTRNLRRKFTRYWTGYSESHDPSPSFFLFLFVCTYRITVRSEKELLQVQEEGRDPNRCGPLRLTYPTGFGIPCMFPNKGKEGKPFERQGDVGRDVYGVFEILNIETSKGPHRHRPWTPQKVLSSGLFLIRCSYHDNVTEPH